METLMKADIFFFVSTSAVIIFIILGIAIAWYLIKILKNVKEATDILKNKIKAIDYQLDEIKKGITESSIFRFIFTKRK